MASRRLTHEQHMRIAELREDGRSEAHIASIIGCSTSAVGWVCLKLGAELPVPASLRPYRAGAEVATRNGRLVWRFTPEEDAHLLAMEAAGLSLHAIGRELGRRHHSVLARLRTLARRDARTEAA